MKQTSDILVKQTKFDYQALASKCVKCAKCIPECTIHNIKGDEINSPRGFIELLASYDRGDINYSKALHDTFNSCFLCYSCTHVCPSKIRVDEAIENMRFDLAQKHGISFYKKAIFYALSHRKLMDIFAKMGYVFSPCYAKKAQNGAKLKFSVPFMKKGKLIPSFSKKSFLNSNQKEFYDNGGDINVGFFVGCLSNYFYTDTAFAMLGVCKALKINVDILKSQHCCGAPAYFTGAFDSTYEVAKQNVDYLSQKLEKLDFVVVPEATCHAMIKLDYEHLFTRFEDKIYLDKIKSIKDKILLTSDFFANHTNAPKLAQISQKQDIKVTYHDPCHAYKMQGVYKQSRALLSGYTLKEQSKAGVCCGFGGVSMQTEYAKNAQNAGKLKVELLKQTQADIVSAECSACRMQISSSLDENNVDMKFYHPLELLLKTIERENNNGNIK